MNQYLSEKLKTLSAVAIISVLYIHSRFRIDEIEGMVLNSYVQGMISIMIGRCAVPLFYLISGYLFFYKTPEGMHSIFKKMKKRISTLLIPYIIAAVFCVAFGFVLAKLPNASRYMHTNVLPLFEKDWGAILFSVFYDAGEGLPVAFQLWFLRDLIILVLLSPIWYLLFKYLKGSWIIIVFILNYFPVNYFPVYALFWFGLGGALKNIHSYKFNRKTDGIVLLLLFLIISFIQLFSRDLIIWKYLETPIIILGVAAIWFTYDCIVSSKFSLQQHACLLKASSFTFFIYLFHVPALSIIRQLIVFGLGKNEAGYLVSYLTSPWIFMIVALMLGSIFKKYTPGIYGVVVGGR
jgi:surface polysaccharide O-acyltransferase-like enzyme